MTEKDFVEYVVQHSGEKICTICGKWHKSQDTFSMCCYDNSSALNKLLHFETIAIKIKTEVATNNNQN